MTFNQLSVDLFWISPKSASAFMQVKEYPVYPAGIEEVELHGADPNDYQVWVDEQRKCVYIYWPEYRLTLSRLSQQGPSTPDRAYYEGETF
jgi:hypothetical protein